MAIEPKRGCGYRKVNGIYLVMGPAGFECDRLPLELSVCPCCGEGVKFSRGFTWIQPLKLFGGDHVPPCSCQNPMPWSHCPVCEPSYHFAPDGRAGLMWIGEKYYSTESFSQEAAELGISKRIAAIPHGFKIGETWIFLAHKKAVKNNVIFDGKEVEKPAAGIFMAFKPARIEKIVLKSEFDLYQAAMNDIRHEPSPNLLDTNGQFKISVLFEVFDEWAEDQAEILKRLHRDTDRGLTLIPVPDEDPDHNPTADPEYLPPEERQIVNRTYDDRPASGY